MHGKGAGDDGPIITRASREKRHMNYELKRNMIFIFKPAAVTADGNSLCIWGDTVVITDKGAKRLGTRPHDLCVSGG
jgi:Xaa-Pro dipeptidase